LSFASESNSNIPCAIQTAISMVEMSLWSLVVLNNAFAALSAGQDRSYATLASLHCFQR